LKITNSADVFIREVKQKHICKRHADSHENDDFDTATDSMLKLFFDSKGYGVKNLTFYVGLVWFA